MFKKFVGKHILTGGNWRNAEDKTPLDVYQRQVTEELGRRWVTRLLRSVTPFADYLEIILPEEHGYEGMKEIVSVTNGTVYAIVSVFASTLEGEELQEELKVPSRELNPDYLKRRIRSRESYVSVFTIDDLDIGGDINNFGAGAGKKLRDYLDEVYGIKLSVETPNGSSERLVQTIPLTPYADRDMLPYLRVNPLRVDTLDSQAPFRRV